MDINPETALNPELADRAMAACRRRLLTLPDGTPVLLRPVGPEDRTAVMEAFAKLSPDSRYFRFWSNHARLPDAVLHRFLSADHIHHTVWAALDPGRPAELGFGAGSWWRHPGEPASAEISFTIADEAQHRGIGTLLLAQLWLLARQQGITCFQAHALPDNYAVLDWFRALGAAVSHEGGQFTLRLGLEQELLPVTTSGTARRLRHWLDHLHRSP